MVNEFESIHAFDADAPFATGDDVLAFYSMGEEKNVGRDVAIVFAFGVMFYVAFGLVLQFAHSGRR